MLKPIIPSIPNNQLMGESKKSVRRQPMSIFNFQFSTKVNVSLLDVQEELVQCHIGVEQGHIPRCKNTKKIQFVKKIYIVRDLHPTFHPLPGPHPGPFVPASRFGGIGIPPKAHPEPPHHAAFPCPAAVPGFLPSPSCPSGDQASPPSHLRLSSVSPPSSNGGETEGQRRRYGGTRVAERKCRVR